MLEKLKEFFSNQKIILTDEQQAELASQLAEDGTPEQPKGPGKPKVNYGDEKTGDTMTMEQVQGAIADAIDKNNASKDAEIKALQKQVDEARAKSDTKEVDAIIEDAISKGKTTPANAVKLAEQFKADPGALQTFFATVPENATVASENGNYIKGEDGKYIEKPKEETAGGKAMLGANQKLVDKLAADSVAKN